MRPKHPNWIAVFGLGLALGYIGGQQDLVPAASADEPKPATTTQQRQPKAATTRGKGSRSAKRRLVG